MENSAATSTAWSTAARGLRILLKGRLPLGHTLSAERFRCSYFALVLDFLSSISEILCRICECPFVLRFDYERFWRLLVPFALQAHFIGTLHFAPELGLKQPEGLLVAPRVCRKLCAGPD